MFFRRDVIIFASGPAYAKGGQNMAKKDNKHSKLTINDRMLIQACIAKGESAASIAERIGFSTSTVYREIERGSQIRNPGAGKCPKVGRLGICNFCGKRSYCRLEKRFYDYEAADAKAGRRRRESRSGTRVSAGDVAKLDSLSQQIRDTGSIHHVFVANKWAGEICCERTLRRLVYSGALSVKPHELRRYVRFKRDLPKPPKAKKIVIRDVRALVGRTHGDFLDYTAAHKRAIVTQYDSVVGKRDDKMAILTITFPRFNLQIGRLVKKGDPSSAKKAIVAVMSKLIAAGFPNAFEACLCDNGTEFATFYEIEGYAKSAGATKCRAFYARPYRSNDKAECERNHGVVRYVFPKGKSLDGLTQKDVDGAFDNINSLVRTGKGDRTPSEAAERAFGKAFLEALGIKKIDKRKVRLAPLI